MQAVVLARASLDNDLRLGVTQRQFQLYYQAQVDDAGSLTGAEALLRWHHPQRGMVMPAEFIPAAEESDLILSLGDWVLEGACAQLVTWAMHPATAPLTISINVSPRQFRQARFCRPRPIRTGRERRRSAQAQAGADENLLLDDVGLTISKMEALKALAWASRWMTLAPAIPR